MQGIMIWVSCNNVRFTLEWIHRFHLQASNSRLFLLKNFCLYTVYKFNKLVWVLRNTIAGISSSVRNKIVLESVQRRAPFFLLVVRASFMKNGSWTQNVIKMVDYVKTWSQYVFVCWNCFSVTLVCCSQTAVFTDRTKNSRKIVSILNIGRTS